MDKKSEHYAIDKKSEHYFASTQLEDLALRVFQNPS
jgi:hypothetical protein